MNRNILIIIGIAILAIVLGGVFVLSQQANNPDEAMMDKNPPSESIQEATTDDKMMDKSSDSRYIEYSKAVLDQSSDKRRVLYFYASWCPVCRPADADFKKNSSKIPEDTVVIRVNYNDPDTDQEEKDLAKKYAITYQHTFVQIDAQGKEITKWSGGQTDELLANLK